MMGDLLAPIVTQLTPDRQALARASCPGPVAAAASRVITSTDSGPVRRQSVVGAVFAEPAGYEFRIEISAPALTGHPSMLCMTCLIRV